MKTQWQSNCLGLVQGHGGHLVIKYRRGLKARQNKPISLGSYDDVEKMECAQEWYKTKKWIYIKNRQCYIGQITEILSVYFL